MRAAEPVWPKLLKEIPLGLLQRVTGTGGHRGHENEIVGTERRRGADPQKQERFCQESRLMPAEWKRGVRAGLRTSGLPWWLSW